MAQSSTTTSSTPSTGGASTPSGGVSTGTGGVLSTTSPAAPSQPTFATNRGVVNETNRDQVAVRPGTVISTRSLTDARRGTTVQGTAPVTSVVGTGGAATAFDLAAQQRAAQRSVALQQLASLDSRLDDLLAAVNTSMDGTQRDQALATAVQELASQITGIRQALTASGFDSFERLADGRTIFISPNSARSSSRQVNRLTMPTTVTDIAGVPLITNLTTQSVSASSMSMQAAARRGGDPNEPIVAGEGG
jgi:hypothetical protein